MTPRLSLLVVTRNQAEFLPRCLTSLITQEADPSLFEVIVVNDASTDETRRILKGYQDRIRVIHLAWHQGLAKAANVGLKEVQAPFFMRVDSDDWLDSKAVAFMLAVLRDHPKVDILLPHYWEVYPSKKVRKIQDPDDLFTWIAAGPLLRTREVRAQGGYRPLFWEEYDLYLRLRRKGAVARVLPKPILFYRRHDRSMTADHKKREKGWRELVAAHA